VIGCVQPPDSRRHALLDDAGRRHLPPALRVLFDFAPARPTAARGRCV
jgi:hypothetical protein